MLEKALNEWMDSHPRIAHHREKWLWLWKMVVYHRPEHNCRMRGNKSLFALLPEGKTLFKSKGNGLAIGNLSSQILANFYFNEFDRHIDDYCKEHGILYARYMDDMIFTGEKKALLKAISVVRKELVPLCLSLSANKVHIQKSYQSFSAIARTYCRGRVYVSNRTVHNAFMTIRNCGLLLKSVPDADRPAALKRMASRVNSYFGFMKYCKSYAIRRNMWCEIVDVTHRDVWCKNMNAIYVKKR